MAKRLVYDFGWFLAGTLVCAPLSVVTTPAGGFVCAASVYALRVAVESQMKKTPG